MRCWNRCGRRSRHEAVSSLLLNHQTRQSPLRPSIFEGSSGSLSLAKIPEVGWSAQSVPDRNGSSALRYSGRVRAGESFQECTALLGILLSTVVATGACDFPYMNDVERPTVCLLVNLDGPSMGRRSRSILSGLHQRFYQPLGSSITVLI